MWNPIISLTQIILYFSNKNNANLFFNFTYIFEVVSAKNISIFLKTCIKQSNYYNRKIAWTYPFKLIRNPIISLTQIILHFLYENNTNLFFFLFNYIFEVVGVKNVNIFVVVVNQNFLSKVRSAKNMQES